MSMFRTPAVSVKIMNLGGSIQPLQLSTAVHGDDEETA
jgi:hypothetical protein